MKSFTLCDRCRGRAGVRWCLPGPDPPDILHILLRPSSGRPLRKDNKEHSKSDIVCNQSWIRISSVSGQGTSITFSVVCDYWKRKLYIKISDYTHENQLLYEPANKCKLRCINASDQWFFSNYYITIYLSNYIIRLYLIISMKFLCISFMAPEMFWIKDNNIKTIYPIFNLCLMNQAQHVGSQSIFYKWAVGGAKDSFLQKNCIRSKSKTQMISPL